jgi:hypothetical protein
LYDEFSHTPTLKVQLLTGIIVGDTKL